MMMKPLEWRADEPIGMGFMVVRDHPFNRPTLAEELAAAVDDDDSYWPAPPELPAWLTGKPEREEAI